MSAKTGIEWTDATWNVVIGCDKVSPGCDNCYAIKTAHRMQAHPNPKIVAPYAGTEAGGEWTGRVNLVEDRLSLPLQWKSPMRIFVNAQSDLFHDLVPDDFIAQVFAVMMVARQHTFQVLTKRHGRMRSLLNSGVFQTAAAEHMLAMTDADEVKDAGDPFPLPNVWLGVSTENQYWADRRVPALLGTPAAARFISAEPLLGPIDLLGDAEKPGPAILRTGVQLHPGGPSGPAEYDYDDQIGIDWVIAGGESGRDDRPMHVDWARSLRDQCSTAGIPFLFKQWGESVPLGQMTDDARRRWDDTHGGDVYPDESLWRIGKKAAGRELDGRTWDQYPEVSGV